MKIIFIILAIIGYFIIGYAVIKILLQHKLITINKYSVGFDTIMYTLIFPLILLFYAIKAAGELLHKKIDGLIKLDWVKELKGGKRNKLTSPEKWVGWVDVRVDLNEQQKEYVLFGMKELEKNIRDEYKNK